MITNHPSEEELQAYASGIVGTDTTLSLHINTCESCKATIMAYQLIANEIRQSQGVTFEFDLAATVLAQLPDNRAVINKRLDLLLAAIAFVLVAAPLYVYRDKVTGLFAGVSALILFTSCAVAVIMIVFRLHEIYQKYHRQMIALGQLNTLQP